MLVCEEPGETLAEAGPFAVCRVCAVDDLATPSRSWLSMAAGLEDGRANCRDILKDFSVCERRNDW